MRSFLLLLSLAFGASAAQAQNVVLSDDFNDGVIDPMWTVTFNPLMFWDVSENGGSFNYWGLTTPFGATDERFALSADLVPPLSTFQVDANFQWDDQVGFLPGENVELFVIVFYDATNTPLAGFRFNDDSFTDAGAFQFIGNSTDSIPGIPAGSDGSISLKRDAAGEIHYTMDVTGGPSASGSVGVLSGDVHRVEFYVSHTAAGGPFGPFLGKLQLDNFTVLDGPTGLGFEMTASNFVAGGLAQLDVARATPGGLVMLGYSLAGNGPTMTPFGLADLSAPIQTLPSLTADAGGSASLNSALPANSAGLNVWLQAYDVAAAEFSNGLHEIVQ
ncbi:MAG: hypothetical protein QF489_00280 [Planctomycetota bacterium]|jgi:hypothetical protein|nr:hypothetical protein [Planctomycetota bacterium]